MLSEKDCQLKKSKNGCRRFYPMRETKVAED